VSSIEIENEDGTVFAGDFERLAGFHALVATFSRNPFWYSLPVWRVGLERLDVERLVCWRPDGGEEFPKTVEPFDLPSFCAKMPPSILWRFGLASGAALRYAFSLC
jgi:hypothetical protein